MKKYIPNILTTYRLIVAFLMLPLYLYASYTMLIYLFISAIITDLLDGFLARRWNVVSVYGKIVDIIGDKLLAFSTTLIFIINTNKMFIITLILEVIIAIISITSCFITNSFKTKDFTEHNSSIYGKIKTLFLFILLGIGTLSFKFNIFDKLLLPAIIITAITQVITIIDYINFIKKNRLHSV